MTETARLVVEADTTSVRRASDDLRDLAGDAAPAAGRASDDFGRRAREANNSAGTFDKGVSFLKNNLASLAATLSVGMFTAWIKGAIDAGDAALKGAQSAGLSVEEYNKLNMAFSLGAGEGANMKMSMSKLNTEIATGGEKLAALGISTTTASGQMRSSYQVMLDVADQFKSMEDGAEKAGLAVELFGERAGPALVPLLNGGREAIEKAGAAAAKMSEDFARMSEQANDNVTLLTGQMDSFRNTIAEKVLPRVNDMLEWAIAFGPTLKPIGDLLFWLSGIITGPLTFAFKSIATTMSLIMGTLTAVGQTIAAVAAGFVKLASGDFRGAYAAVSAGVQDVGKTAAGVRDQLFALWGEEEQGAKAHAATMTTELAKVAAANAAKAGKGSATMDASTGIVTEDFGASMAAQTAALSEQRATQLAIEQSFNEAKKTIAVDQGELQALRDRDDAWFHQQRLDRIKEEVAAQERGVQAIGRLLAAGAAKNKVIAKAALAFNKVMALTQIAQDTPVAALAAAKSVAGIPVIGSKLAFLAYNAVYGLGYAAYAAVASGGGGFGGGGGGGGASAISATQSQPTLQQSAQPAQTQQNVIFRLSGSTRYSPEEVAGLLSQFGETLADNGGRIGNVQVQLV